MLASASLRNSRPTDKDRAKSKKTPARDKQKTNNQLRFSDEILLLDAAAKNDLDEEGNNNNNITEDTRETTFLFQRISTALRRGNGVSFHNTMVTQ